ncbi:hypothetical protein FM038_020820 [Shewanella eurypsychrophilus]|uniref:Uncharacterized protein n=1 Tax=Shewanella eurypsychrophilus TaxID=2593656 RepID=A0ABX6VB08_9GAMM|nr:MULTISPECIES: hypothetical protein [Shewanella]QFU24349.1 hypothetical protein FS418_22525 [Shewanella sp. YLB-09]QPG59549.1 hypothetical protein FM038_020820 [Shewanella eurypsychrophilus]
MFKYLVLASLLFTTCSTWGAMDEEDYDRWSKAAKKIELSKPYLLCEKAAKVVINQDVALFREIFVETPATDEQVKAFLAEEHNKFFMKTYLGINNYQIKKGKEWAFENAKNSKNYIVSSSAEQWGYDLELWVEYIFDTFDARNNTAHVAWWTMQTRLLTRQVAGYFFALNAVKSIDIGKYS